MLHNSLHPAAATIGLATIAKIPISTTHATGGAVSGGGATRGPHAMHWIWGEKSVVAWVGTFPWCSIDRCRRIFVCSLCYSAWVGPGSVDDPWREVFKSSVCIIERAAETFWEEALAVNTRDRKILFVGDEQTIACSGVVNSDRRIVCTHSSCAIAMASCLMSSRNRLNTLM